MSGSNDVKEEGHGRKDLLESVRHGLPETR